MLQKFRFKGVRYIDVAYEEVITRRNLITIEVENEDQGELIENKIIENQTDYDHPDCIFEDLHSMNVEVAEVCQGAKECEYEIL